MIDIVDSKKGSTQGGKRTSEKKKENSDRNSVGFNSIKDRMVLDSHGADILSPLKDLRFLIQLNIPLHFPFLNLAC